MQNEQETVAKIRKFSSSPKCLTESTFDPFHSIKLGKSETMDDENEENYDYDDL